MNYISGFFTPSDPIAAAEKKVEDANAELASAKSAASGTIPGNTVDGVGGRRKKTRRGGKRKSRKLRKLRGSRK